MREQALLAVFAHPDDETLRPGGTLALLAHRGVRVIVLTAPRGEAASGNGAPQYGHTPIGGWSGILS